MLHLIKCCRSRASVRPCARGYAYGMQLQKRSIHKCRCNQVASLDLEFRKRKDSRKSRRGGEISHGINPRQAVAWLSQSATLKPALRSALAASAHLFFCTSQLRFKAAFRLRKSALFSTWKLRPPTVTAGAEIPPRAPVKAWRLVPLELAVATVAVAVLVSMELVAVAAGASVAVTVTVTVAAHLVAVSSATPVVVVAATSVVTSTPGFPAPPMACKPHQYVDRTQEKASTY